MTGVDLVKSIVEILTFLKLTTVYKLKLNFCHLFNLSNFCFLLRLLFNEQKKVRVNIRYVMCISFTKMHKKGKKTGELKLNTY